MGAEVKLKKWALLAEVLSGFAILATLVILVLDVRSNSRLLGRQLYIERVDRNYYLNNPEVISIVEKMAIEESSGTPRHLRELMSRFDLTLSEAQRWSSYAWRIWQIDQADYLYRNTDRLEDDILVSLDDPGLALYLELRPTLFDENFVAFVNDLKAMRD